MLSEESLEKLSERLVNRIEDLNAFMIKKLARQLKDIGTLTPSQLREVFQSVKYGNDINEIINKIVQINNANVEDIYSIFEEVAKKNQNYAKQFYEYRNISFIPYESNTQLQALVRALATNTSRLYLNISNSSAFGLLQADGSIRYTKLSEVYQKLTDNAILNITTGRESYEKVIKDTIKNISRNGIQYVDYSSGYHRRLDSSVRMNIMDGIRGLENELQRQFGEEFGADGVEVVHHKNPAPDHSTNDKDGWYDIDGKQFSIEEYSNINNRLVRKVSTMNCYHYTIPIIKGVSKPIYSEEELKRDKKANIEGFEFEDKHYTNYEGTQLLRRLELEIRKCKDEYIGYKSAELNEEAILVQRKITYFTKKYKELSKISGLPTRIERLKVNGYKK